MTGIMRSTAVAALVMVLAAGCAQGPTREQTGTVLGGLAGAAVGSTIGEGTGKSVAIGIGAIAGALAGQAIGNYLDEQDRRHIGRSLETNRTGQTTSWRNPDTGANYAVTPTRTYERQDRVCREFVMDARIQGEAEEVHGTACRQPDGTWRIQQ